MKRQFDSWRQDWKQTLSRRQGKDVLAMLQAEEQRLAHIHVHCRADEQVSSQNRDSGVAQTCAHAHAHGHVPDVRVRDFAFEAAAKNQRTGNPLLASSLPPYFTSVSTSAVSCPNPVDTDTLQRRRLSAETNINNGIAYLFEYEHELSNVQKEIITRYCEAWGVEYRRVARALVDRYDHKEGKECKDGGVGQSDQGGVGRIGSDGVGAWIDPVFGGFCNAKREKSGEGVWMARVHVRQCQEADSKSERYRSLLKLKVSMARAKHSPPIQRLRVHRTCRFTNRYGLDDDDTQIIPLQERITGFAELTALPLRSIRQLYSLPVKAMNWRERIVYHASLSRYNGEEESISATDENGRWEQMAPSKGLDVLAKMNRRPSGKVSVRELYQRDGGSIPAPLMANGDLDTDGTGRIDWAARRAG